MQTEQKFDNLEDMFREAEDTFRKGVGTLSVWSDQARDLIKNKPSVILAAVGVSGFVMGSLLRHGFSTRRSLRSGGTVTANTLPGFVDQGLPADPFVLFLAGAVAGLAAGPRLLQEAIAGIDRYGNDQEENIIGLNGARNRGPNPSMDQRPFEKT